MSDSRATRQRALLVYLRASATLAFVAAVTGTVVPGRAGRAAATAAIVVLVAAAVGRLVWLAARWARKGDWRFSAAALAVVAVVAAGGLLVG